MLILIIFRLLYLTHQILCQEQNFIIKPSDTNVIIGETALIKCSVTSIHGDVQWIHDGTALGYDRKVRGKPRYSVIWLNNENTEYHLQIVNVTLDDEGVYACQAAPIGDWTTKLESKAKLTVLIAPKTQPQMTFIDELKNNNDLIHIKSNSFKTSKFSCKIKGSKPVANIKWYLNDTQLTTSNSIIAESEFKDGPNLIDKLSILEFKSTLQFNNSILKCIVEHEAFKKNETLQSTLRIVVVYPPSVPLITGYDISHGILVGSYLTLTCSSTYTYPPAKLTWFKDKTQLTTNYETIDSRTESKYIFKTELNDNQALFRCDSINQALDLPLSSEIKLNVLFGPTKIDMSGNFEVKIGEEIKATCQSDSSNPASKIHFTFDGINYLPLQPQVNLPSTNYGFNSTATFSKIVNREHNGKELKCLIENTASRVQKEIVKQIKVFYPIDSLELNFDNKAYENRSIVEGTKIKLFCQSKGGNPSATIEWKINGNVRNGFTTAYLFSTDSYLEIELTRELHNQIVECKATNKVGSLTKSLKLNVSYLPSNVKIMTIEPAKIDSTTPVKAGSKVIIACITSNSNPDSEIKWYKDSYLISTPNSNRTFKYLNVTSDFETTSYLEFIATSSDHTKEIRCDVNVLNIQRTLHSSMILNVAFQPELIRQPLNLIDINENMTFKLNLSTRANPPATYDCKANGKSYKVENSSLEFITTRNDNGLFKCLINNTVNTTEVSFKLNVKYSTTTQANSTLYITNKDVQLNLFCIINGNPLELNHIEWKLNNQKIVPSQRLQNKLLSLANNQYLGILTINSVSDLDDGNYSCHVNNQIGQASQAQMSVYVKRQPVILADSTLKAAENSNRELSAKLICKVNAYPDVTFKWKLGNNVEIINSTKYTILNSKIGYQLFSSTLIIAQIVSNDYRNYICEVKNDIGLPVIAEATLSGKHQPEQPSDFRVTNITRNSITLAWRKNFDGGDAQKFRVRYLKDTFDPTYKYIDIDGDQTSLTIDNLEMATRYVINIQSLNSYGTEGFLKDPLIVQTEFSFNDVNQMPIYNGNDLPLTIILIVCGVGTLLLLFNVALIVYFIRKRKHKDETDSTTGTNETDTNTVEMFSPPPPYPDELNYQFGYDDENRPFVNGRLPQDIDYTVEYATPLPTWNDDVFNDDICNFKSFKDTKPIETHTAYPIRTIKQSPNGSDLLTKSTIYQDVIDDEFKGHLV